MAITLQTHVSIGGLIDKAITAHLDARPLLRRTAIHGMNRGTERLTQVLKQSNAGIRSGRLMASITAGVAGQGGGDTIFEVNESYAEAGSNLPYAKKVQEGGFIYPKNKKSLAIPLRDNLRRDQVWPREFAPDALVFRHYFGRKPNVFGLLLEKETGEPYYALAYWVNLEPRPYLYWDDEDRRVIAEELYPQWVARN